MTSFKKSSRALLAHKNCLNIIILSVKHRAGFFWIVKHRTDNIVYGVFELWYYYFVPKILSPASPNPGHI